MPVSNEDPIVKLIRHNIIHAAIETTEMIAWVLSGVFAVSFAVLLLLYIVTLCVYKRKMTLMKSKHFQAKAPNGGFEMDGNLCYQSGMNKDDSLYECIKE